MCDPYVSQPFPSLLIEISNNLQCLVSFKLCFQWFEEVWVLSWHTSLIICALRVSLSCSSLMCILPICTRLWSTKFVYPQAQWVGVPSIFHPYLMQMASLNSYLVHSLALTSIAQCKDVPFPLHLWCVVVPEGSGPPIVCHDNCSILCLSVAIFCLWWFWCVAGPWCCIWGQVFGCRFSLLVLQWSEF